VTASRPSRIDWLIFAALGLAWGSSYLFIKIGVGTLPPFTLVAGRLLIGASILGVILWLSREPLPRERGMYGRLLVMSVINIALPFALITWGEQSIDSALAAILNATVPLMTIVIAPLVFADEWITVNRLIGLGLGFVGVVVLVSGSLGGADGSLFGALALLGSSLSYAIGNVYARRSVKGLRPMVPAFFQVGFGALIVTGLAIVFDRPWTLAPAPEAVFSVIWLGVFGSSLAYIFYFRLLRTWGATRTSTVAYLLPVVGIVLGAIVLEEVVDGRIIVGTALIIGGVAMVNLRRGGRRLFGPAAAAAAAARTE
jgi:drug/metabolite transporter (DMT)-like permease